MDFITHPARLTILSRRSNPSLDAPKSVWDTAMSFYNKSERGYIANRAAHGYTVIEEEEGIISIIYFDDANPDQNRGELLYSYGPDIFRFYSLEGDALLTRINHVKEREKDTP